MTKLPAATAAVVDDRKVREYLLSARHPQNGGKAMLFGAFGFDAECWLRLKAALVTIWIVENGAPPRLVTAYR